MTRVEESAPVSACVMTIRSGLYYPFHLCPPDSLEHFLSRYDTVHFRDYMALQLTPTSGTIAHSDRMGDRHPNLLERGRIVQGHHVSGPLSAEMDRRVDRDLQDGEWRELFQFALRNDLRFQRGLAEQSASFDPWMPDRWTQWRVTLADIRRMSCLRLDPDHAISLAYGLMLVTTSASLWHTIRLCQQHSLDAITDSLRHDHLLQRSMKRDRMPLPTYLWRTRPN